MEEAPVMVVVRRWVDRLALYSLKSWGPTTGREAQVMAQTASAAERMRKMTTPSVMD